MTDTTTTDPFPSGDPTEPNAAKPCPSCGACPTCGRRPESSPFPYQPIPLPGISQPWWQIPPVWCGTDTNQVGGGITTSATPSGATWSLS